MSFHLILAFCVGLGSQHCYTIESPHHYDTLKDCEDSYEEVAIILLQDRSADTRYAYHTCEASP